MTGNKLKPCPGGKVLVSCCNPNPDDPKVYLPARLKATITAVSYSGCNCAAGVEFSLSYNPNLGQWRGYQEPDDVCGGNWLMIFHCDEVQNQFLCAIDSCATAETAPAVSSCATPYFRFFIDFGDDCNECIWLNHVGTMTVEITA